MNKSSLRIPAKLQVGMILERNRKEQTVTDRITVTAIGLENFLAMDCEGKEHHFAIGCLSDYVMDSWDYTWREIGEKNHVASR